jgi:predicted outer membrane repeat protein
MSIISSSSSQQAAIVGDAGVLTMIIAEGTVSLQLVRLLITGCTGDPQNYNICIYLFGLDRVTFDDITLSSNVGSDTSLQIKQADSAVFSRFLAESNYNGIIFIYQASIVTFSDCIFRDNSLTTYAAGFDNVGNLHLTNTVVKNNTGGAILYFGTIGNVTLTNAAMSNNSVTYCLLNFRFVLGVSIAGCSFSNNIGCVAESNAVYFVVTDSVFDSNSGHDLLGIVALGGTSYFTNCNFTYNSNHAVGAINTGLDVPLFVTRCLFERNNGHIGSGAIQSGGPLDVDDCLFLSNTVSDTGGAISMEHSNNVRIVRSTFIGNYAGNNGGAIYVTTANNVSIVECSFTDNYAGTNGGVIMFSGKSTGITIQGSNFTRNIAQSYGGSVYFAALNSNISIVANIFTENRALTGSGGALYFKARCSLISIGGPRPIALSTAAASYTTWKYGFSKLNYFGVIYLPEASGFYVTFDKSTSLSNILNENGIDVSGDDGIAFRGGYYWQKFYSYQTTTNTIAPSNNISLWPGIGGNSPLYVRGQNLSYRIHEEDDAYFGTVFPVLKKRLPNIFTGNTASDSGGAIFWGDTNTDIFIMPGTLFTNNSVTSPGGSGGAIYMQLSNNLIHIFSLNFTRNRAHMGGAITLLNANNQMSLSQCSFVDNHAGGYGGAIYFGNGNGDGLFHIIESSAIKLIDTVFRNNSAVVSGGAVYLSESNAVTCYNTVMTGNTAKHTGGALHFEYRNIAVLTYTSFIDNDVERHGGAIKSVSGNNITFEKLAYLGQNHAGVDGGAISMSLASIVSFSGATSFIGNDAARSGGAILSSASTLVLGASVITFESNSASQGSALRLDTMVFNSIAISPSYSPITIADNKCSGRGGTVSWVKDPSSSAGIFDASAIPNFRRVVYRNNSAIFGIKSSTQATKVQLVGDSISYVNDYNRALHPSPTVHLLDYFSAKDITDSTTIVTATIESHFCLGHAGYLSGVTTVKASKGDAHFANLTAFCFPGGNMTLKYTGKREHLNGSFALCYGILFFLSFTNSNSFT